LKIEAGENEEDQIGTVRICEDDQGLAAGQFAAFYDEKRCIGSGVILESWDDRGFPVCQKALQIAQINDISKLGKPVKIKVKPDDELNAVTKGGVELIGQA
jgi:tRNA-specific 2-thiouridylase